MHHDELNLASVCRPSDDVVAREIEGEVLIVPLIDGVGDVGGGLYTLNQTGQTIWKMLDGRRTLTEVAAVLAQEYEAPEGAIEAGVLDFAVDMTGRGILAASA